MALEDSDILEMQKAGLVVESHTANHMHLAKDGEKQEPAKTLKLWTYELTQPLTFIESRFKNKPDWLSYPYGEYDPGLLKAVQATGYKLAFTVNPGPNDRTVNPLMLKRNLVLYPISHAGFARIFQDKVLHLKNLSPGDGDLIDSQEPIVTGQILDDVVPKSVKLLFDNHLMRVQYDPRTHVFRHQITAPPLHRGGHMMTVRAKDEKGNTRVFNCYFRIKHLKNDKNPKNEGEKDAMSN